MKVLIVEEEPELSKSTIAYLEAVNYLCKVAASFKAAIEKTAAYNYDCILLDIFLPD